MRTFDDAASADLAKHRLVASGIEVRLVGAQTVVGADLPATTRGIRVLVDAADADDATALLGPDHEAEIDEDDDEPGPRCPRCESTYVSEGWSTFETAFGYAFFGVPFKLMRKKTRCGKCGHEWSRGIERAPRLDASYRGLQRREGNPVFRLRRGHGLAGFGCGLVGGLVLSIFSPHASAVYFTLAPLAGALLGSGARNDVCSKPGCRARLPPSAERCPRCDGVVAGTILRPEEHFARKAAWHRGTEMLDP